MIQENKSTPASASRLASNHRLCLLVCVVCVAFYVANLNSLQIGQHVDDSVYISLARSLNSGLGYVRFEDPAHPAEPQYPPAMAYLIAAMLAISGGNLEALRLIPLLFSLASLPLAYLFFLRRIPDQLDIARSTWAAVLLSLFGLNHLIVGYAGMVMTEAPFVCLTLAAAVWLDRLDASGNAGIRQASPAISPCTSAGWIVGMAGILAVCCLMRTVAYTYLVAATLWLWCIRRRRTAIAVATLTVIALIPWLIAQRQATGAWFGGGYLADILSSGDTSWHTLLRPVENLVTYSVQLLPAAMLPFFGDQVGALATRLSVPWLPLLAGVLVTGLVAVGAWWHRSQRHDPASYLCAAMAAMLLVWSHRYTRFCLPLVPICLVYLLTVAQRFSYVSADGARKSRRPAWILVVAGIIATGFVARDVEMIYRPPRHTYINLQAIAHFVENYTPTEATIITHAPYTVAVYTRRSLIDLLPPKRLGAPLTAEPSEFLLRSAAFPPRFVLIYPLRPGEAPQVPDFLAHPPFRLRAREEQLGAVLYTVDPYYGLNRQLPDHGNKLNRTLHRVGRYAKQSTALNRTLYRARHYVERCQAGASRI